MSDLYRPFILHSLRNARAKRSIYAGSFLFGGLGVLATNSVLLLSFWAMLRFLGAKSPLSARELCVLYGVSFLATALARMCGSGLDFLASEIPTGGLDLLLVRPVPLALQLLCHDFLLRLLVPASAWTAVVAWLVLSRASEAGPLAVLTAPLYVALAALLIYSLQGTGYALAFKFPRLTAVGEAMDPLCDTAGKLPLASAEGTLGGAALGLAHLLGYRLMRGLLGGSQLEYGASLVLLAVVSLGAFALYRRSLEAGLRGYTSGSA